MEKIIGCIHKQGEYQGRTYDNYVFCTDYVTDKKRNSIGTVCDNHRKIRARDLSAFCPDPKDLIGKKVEFKGEDQNHYFDFIKVLE